jgi:hypothetical protein
MVVAVIRSEDNDATQRLSTLRRAQPADATLRNLLGVLNAKLELCARLPVYEWEAQHAGQDGCARAFGKWAEAEHRSCAEVLDCLREVLAQQAPVPQQAGIPEASCG